MKYADSVNYWKAYEATKNKNFIDFRKNKEAEKKFIELIKKLKQGFIDGCSI